MDPSSQPIDQQMSSSMTSITPSPQSTLNVELATTQPNEVIVHEDEGAEDDVFYSSEDEGLLATLNALEEIKKQAEERRKALNRQEREQSVNRSDAGPTSSTTSDMETSILSTIITPSTPPNWERQYRETITSLTETWKLFAVDENTAEFKVVTGLIAPLIPVIVQKIVNPELWSHYEAQRSHMLRKKMEKLEDMITLGMDETEAKTRVDRIKCFPTNPMQNTREGRYSLNESLLLHCSNRVQSAEDIMADGVDERLTSIEIPNHLGKGTYFVDDPMESDSYTDDRNIIMIFSVLLGDCKDFGNNGHEALGFKRAPRKNMVESRHIDDHFFDSITARNNARSTFNEYVIYNRNQCYPLYKVKYRGSRNNKSKSAMALALDPKVPDNYPAAREMSPSIAWKELPRSPNDPIQIFMPNQQQNPPWPFFSLNLFREMGVDISAPSTAILNMNPLSTQSPSTNRKRKRNDLTIPTASTSQDHGLTLECPECFEMIEVAPTTWKEVACKHDLCAVCFAKFEKTGTTLSGVTHTSFRCPFCNQIDGIEIGDFPNGVVMLKETINTSCEGFPNHRTITINYKLDDGASNAVNTKTFIPDNAKGQRIAKLLAIACDRRLIFKTGPNSSILWNISHKTAQNGGVLAAGYPDPDYLVRVLKELKSFGIN